LYAFPLFLGHEDVRKQRKQPKNDILETLKTGNRSRFSALPGLNADFSEGVFSLKKTDFDRKSLQ
jgi:hypothetical protein